MIKSYEAIYDKGLLKWTDNKPEIEDGTPVTVVVDTTPSKKRRRKEIQKVLNATRGAWGRGKSLDEIDREIETMRTAAWE